MACGEKFFVWCDVMCVCACVCVCVFASMISHYNLSISHPTELLYNLSSSLSTSTQY